jgi:hypothetical protein
MPAMPLAPAESAPSASSVPEQVMDLPERLGKLRDAEVVTPEEFGAKKADLLRRL